LSIDIYLSLYNIQVFNNNTSLKKKTQILSITIIGQNFETVKTLIEYMSSE